MAVGISSNIFRRKGQFLLKNIKTLAIGIAIGIIISFVINVIFPTTIGSEIISRILGSTADYFFVALFSGLGGAFAFFWPGVIEAVAGIAISVALIPPVVMVGIGLATLDISLMSQSLEIVVINILGIILGSLLTIIVLHRYAKRKS